MSHARIGRVRMKAGGAEVVPLRLVSIGETVRLDPDKVLATAMGKKLTNLVVIAELPDGDLWLSGIANAGESLILMERAKQQIVDGED
jgi:hypothetical protein